MAPPSGFRDTGGIDGAGSLCTARSRALQPIGASQIREAPMEDEAPPHSDAHPADSLLITGIMTGRLGGSERDSYRGKDQ